MRVCSNFIDLHVAVQLSQYHLLKTLSFFPLYIKVLPPSLRSLQSLGIERLRSRTTRSGELPLQCLVVSDAGEIIAASRGYEIVNANDESFQLGLLDRSLVLD